MNNKSKLFENSAGHKSSSIILEYLFFIILLLFAGYSIISGKDIPTNTMTMLKWIGIALTCGAEGYKINDRFCNHREKTNMGATDDIRK